MIANTIFSLIIILGNILLLIALRFILFNIEDDLVYINQFNFILSGEVYNQVLRPWNGNPQSLYYSLHPH